MRFHAITAMLAVVAIPCAASGVRTSAYTSITNADCRFDPVGDEPGDEESQTKHCPGLAGSRVIVNVGGTSASLDLQWPALRPRVPAARTVVTGWSLGETLEWRGTGTATRFQPDSVILRVLLNPHERRTAERQVLAVLRVRPGSACLLAAVDMTDDQRPYETARALSDARAATFVCGRDVAQAAGPRTTWTRLVLEGRLRDD